MTTRWGILATGRIAHKLAVAIGQSQSGELVAVGSRTQQSADAFASRYEGCVAYPTYEALIAASDVDAIYVSTPHPQHVEWTIKALESGKAVLCEKPMGVNYPEVMAMVHAARTSKSFLMEAFMYRLTSQTQRVDGLVRSGEIGEVRHIHATFGFHAPYDPTSRLFANELAGGGIMDVGCYPVSMARLLMDSEPLRTYGSGVLTDEGVDLCASGLLSFEGGATAQVATGVGQQLDNAVEVFGSRGSIRVPWPWGSQSQWNIEVVRGGKRETMSGQSEDSYVLEVDEVDRCLREGLLESPHMDWNDSLGNVRVLDSWREAVGVAYPSDRLSSRGNPVHGRQLKQTSGRMKYGRVAGIDKKVSRLVFGCDNQPSELHAMVMFDHFYEAGGTAFDTAFIYGGGRMQRFLGSWMEERGIRDEVFVINKGAHTPLDRPEFVEPQLLRSLDDLRTDQVDMYFLHRDNLDVPVGEWIDVLNEQRDAGRIALFGGSNWTLERVKEANDWAQAHAKEGLSAVSNQFSLAKMLDPVWPGCVSANSPPFVEYLAENHLALFPWSSQARGFFTSRADEILEGHSTTGRQPSSSHPSDDEMKRCWFSEDNLEHRRRALSMAEKQGVEPINVALAYVLAQPFPCFPLIGPRELSETESCLNVFSVEMEQQDLNWLQGVLVTSSG